MSSQKVFVQFRYCPLCRINHKKGKKHVFAKRHQDIVTGVLAKFIKKIVFAKSSMKKPPIHENSWEEVSKTFWCYFCQNEIEKHRKNVTVTGDCIIEQGGMLEHLTRGDHVENTVKFLRENKIDLSRTADYILSTNDYLKYLEVVDTACSQYFKEKTDGLKLLAKDLKNQELYRSQVFSSGLLDQNQNNQQQRKAPKFSHGAPLSSQNSLRSGNADEQGKKTIQAFGEGLTAIERANEDDSLGNIYTNALPPWLIADEEEPKSSGIIGPTFEDLEKHRKLEKKRQLPSCRVGAKFDHKTDTAESWLPNFGGVWSHSRRTNSAQHFNRRQGRKISTSKQSTISDSRGSQVSPQSGVQTNLESFTDLPHSTDFTQLASTAVAETLVKHRSQADQFVPGRDNFFTFSQHSTSTCSDVQMLDQGNISQSDIISVKPYVRKRKPPNTEAVVSNLHQSLFDEFRPDKSFEKWDGPLKPNHHTSPSITTQGLNFGFNCNSLQPYQKNRKSNNSKITGDVHGTGTLRLISTPVLNQTNK